MDDGDSFRESQPASQPANGEDPIEEVVRDDDEAIEENQLQDQDNAQPDDEEEEGEDLLENAQNDYVPMEHLDNYQRDDAAEAEANAAGDMSFEQRQEAEAELDRRQRRRARREPRALDVGEDDEVDDEAFAERLARRRRERQRAAAAMEPSDEMEDDIGQTADAMLNLQDKRMPTRQWVVQTRIRQAIKSLFKGFLKTYKDQKDQPVYISRINKMVAENGSSFEVNYFHLSERHPSVGVFVADAPAEVLKMFDEVAQEVTFEELPNYRNICSEIRVRMTDVPVHDNLRDIRNVHLNCLIRVTGVVTRRTGVFPQLKLVKYDCLKCGYVLGPITQNTQHEVQPSFCPECQSKGPFSVNQEQTIYRNFQKIVLQEPPHKVLPGRLPRSKDVILTEDLIDKCRPGDEIEVTGIYTNNFDASLNKKNGLPVFATVIEANNIAKVQRVGETDLTEEEIAEVIKLSKDPEIVQRITASIAPSIYGHDDIKMALAMALFGGQAKEVPGKHRIRGDINVLLLGDPGTAKSQFLKYAKSTAYRAVFTTGKGASAVGLTASVHRDPLTREWTLEGGALVLANDGVCLIDEFDKMNDHDRTSIHEAMEQQTISISKAGIVTTLQARCAVIAAANPVGGRYNSQNSFQQNVDLTEPILSRFDVLCVVRDLVDPDVDENLARFVVHSHAKSHPRLRNDPAALAEKLAAFPAPPPPTAGAELIPQDTLKKYIMYARTKCRPVLRDLEVEKLKDLYADLRRESATGDGLTIAVRHLESIIRMSEAHARMHLRDHVKDEDLNAAIKVMLDSFIATQKFSLQRPLRRAFAKYVQHKKDDFPLVYHLLRSLYNEKLAYYAAKARQGRPIPQSVDIDMDELVAKARDRGITDIKWFLRSAALRESGYDVSANEKVISKPMPDSLRPEAA